MTTLLRPSRISFDFILTFTAIHECAILLQQPASVGRRRHYHGPYGRNVTRQPLSAMWRIC
jgi:hypothetical protein